MQYLAHLSVVLGIVGRVFWHLGGGGGVCVCVCVCACMCVCVDVYHYLHFHPINYNPAEK